MGAATSALKENPLGIMSKDAEYVYLSLVPKAEEKRDRSILLFSEIITAGYATRKSPTLRSASAMTQEARLTSMQTNLSDSAVVVVCVSKGSMHDPNQVCQLSSHF
jgi:hypothetical protein